jgi:hypothetical protein
MPDERSQTSLPRSDTLNDQGARANTDPKRRSQVWRCRRFGVACVQPVRWRVGRARVWRMLRRQPSCLSGRRTVRHHARLRHPGSAECASALNRRWDPFVDRVDLAPGCQPDHSRTRVSSTLADLTLDTSAKRFCRADLVEQPFGRSCPRTAGSSPGGDAPSRPSRDLFPPRVRWPGGGVLRPSQRVRRVR